MGAMITDMNINVFVEYIQNYIKDNIMIIYENIQKNITKHLKCWIYEKNLEAFMEQKIIKVYKHFTEKLSLDMNHKIKKYFNIKEIKLHNDVLKEIIYAYEINDDLMKEQNKTQKISEAMEKLVEKTIDLTLLKCNNEYMKILYDKMDIKGRLVGSIKGNGKMYKARYIKELNGRINGINKNISVRIENELLRFYTRQIYHLEELENMHPYRKVG